MKRSISYLMICFSIAAVNLPGFCFGLTPKVTAIDGGNAHTIAVREDKTVWAYGENGSGQLGNGTNVRKNNPTRLATLSDVVSVVVGSNHSLAVRANGTAWGYWSPDIERCQSSSMWDFSKKA